MLRMLYSRLSFLWRLLRLRYTFQFNVVYLLVYLSPESIHTAILQVLIVFFCRHHHYHCPRRHVSACFFEKHYYYHCRYSYFYGPEKVVLPNIMITWIMPFIFVSFTSSTAWRSIKCYAVYQNPLALITDSFIAFKKSKKTAVDA